MMRVYDLTGNNSILLGEVLKKSGKAGTRRFWVERVWEGIVQWVSRHIPPRFLGNLWHLPPHTRA